MASLQKQQDAAIKNADQTEKLVSVISDLSSGLKQQHDDNIKSQQSMLYATYIMAVATVIMAIATCIMAFKP